MVSCEQHLNQSALSVLDGIKITGKAWSLQCPSKYLSGLCLGEACAFQWSLFQADAYLRELSALERSHLRKLSAI